MKTTTNRTFRIAALVAIVWISSLESANANLNRGKYLPRTGDLRGLHVDPDGMLYVATIDQHRVPWPQYVYSLNRKGRIVGDIAIPRGQWLTRPFQVAFAPGGRDFYVVGLTAPSSRGSQLAVMRVSLDTGAIVWEIKVKKLGRLKRPSVLPTDQVKAAPDGHSITIGGLAHGRETPADRSPFVIRISSKGKVMWSRNFQTGDYSGITDLAVDERGNAYVVTYSSLGLSLSRFDSRGKQVWRREFTDCGQRFGHVATSLDGEVVAIGAACSDSADRQLYLGTLNADGSGYSSNTWHPPEAAFEYVQLWDLAVTAEGELALLVRSWEFWFGPGLAFMAQEHFLVVHANREGVQTGSRLLGVAFGDNLPAYYVWPRALAAHPQGGLVVAGQGALRQRGASPKVGTWVRRLK